MTYPTHPEWDTLQEGCIQFANSMRDQNIGAVVALSRGGLINGVIFSHLLGDIPLIPVDYSSQRGNGDNIGNHSNNIPDIRQHRLLLVDDIADSGHTLSELDFHLRQRGHDVITYVSYWKNDSALTPDGYQFEIPPNSDWIVYPWE